MSAMVIDFPGAPIPLPQPRIYRGVGVTTMSLILRFVQMVSIAISAVCFRSVYPSIMMGDNPSMSSIMSAMEIDFRQSSHSLASTSFYRGEWGSVYLFHSTMGTSQFMLYASGAHYHRLFPVLIRPTVETSTKAVEDQIDEAEDQTQPEKQYAGEALNVVVLHRRKLQYVGHWKLFRHPPPPEIAVGRHQSSTQATPNYWKLSRRPPPPEIAVRRHPSTTQATPNCWKLSRCPPSC
nr:hypothetical protein Iba_chr04aCG12480 [Ipomoea batatas]